MRATTPAAPNNEWLIFHRKQEQERVSFKSQAARDRAELLRRQDVKKGELLAKQQEEEQCFWEKTRNSDGAPLQSMVEVTPVQGARSKAPDGERGQGGAMKTVSASIYGPAKATVATAKSQLRTNFKNTAPEVIDLCSDEEEVVAKKSEPATTTTLADRAGAQKRPTFKIPTATLEVCGPGSKKHFDAPSRLGVYREDAVLHDKPSTTVIASSHASSAQNSENGSNAPSSGNMLQDSPRVPQTEQGSLSQYLPASVSTAFRPAESGRVASTSSLGPSGSHATAPANAPIIGTLTPRSTLMQRKYANQAGHQGHTATHEPPLHGLPLEWRPNRQPGGPAAGLTKRRLDVSSEQLGFEEHRRNDNSPTLQTTDGRLFEREVRSHEQGRTRYDEDVQMNHSTSTREISITPLRQQDIGKISSSSTDHSKQSQANPPASLDQLPSLSPHLHSPVMPATPSASISRKPSKSAGVGITLSPKTPTPRASTISRMPGATPQTPTKRKIFHELSSGDEEDLYKPSEDDDDDHDDDDNYKDGPELPKAENSASKIRNQPVTKKPRFANVFTSAAAAKLMASVKKEKNGFGFKAPASKTALKAFPMAQRRRTTHTKAKKQTSTPTSSSKPAKPTPRTPSRAAKLHAQKRTQECLYQLHRSTSPSEAGDSNGTTHRTAGDTNLHTHIRHLSLTPAPSTVSAADSTSALSTSVSANAKAAADYMAWTRARAGGDRALMKKSVHMMDCEEISEE